MIERLVPDVLSQRPRRYIEPFVGGGAIALAVAERAVVPVGLVINDKNSALMNAWRMVIKFPYAVASNLGAAMDLYGNSQEGYLRARVAYNQNKGDTMGVARAALFIYLNKLCFNGLWRENSKGEMNTPFGKIKNPAIPSTELLYEIAKKFRTAEVLAGSFEAPIRLAQENDAIYADPPYADVFETYTAGGFGKQGQESLAAELQEAHERGANVWTTNSDTPLIRELYAWANVTVLAEPRAVAAKATARKPKECLLIRAVHAQR